jgi:crossover junction endodeoxyribonuclease RuvC
MEASGLIRLRRSESFPVRLRALQQSFEALVDRIRPDLACVEAPFQGVNARAALQLAHSRGVVLAALAGAGVEIREVPPATVKRAVAGSGRADKLQVAFMVRQLLRIRQELPSEDVTDALAVAYCAAVGTPTVSSKARALAPGRSSTRKEHRGARSARAPVVRRSR